MKLLLTILSVLLCTPASSLMRDGDEPLVVQLHEINPADEIQRSSSQIPIECFLDVNNSNITLLSKEVAVCDVTIANETIEVLSAYQCVISKVPTIIPLNTDGEFHITISLSNGPYLYGEFSL